MESCGSRIGTAWWIGILVLGVPLPGAFVSAAEPVESAAPYAPAEPAEPVPLGEILVTTVPTTSERPFEETRAVTVVDRERIADEMPRTLPDALHGEVGVAVQQTTPGQGTPIIRGLLGSSILVLVDGMRLNTAFFRPAPNQYFALVDVQNVESIDILRGTGSTRYGSDAMGGVIDVRTPTPRFDDERWTLVGRMLGRFSSADLGGTGRFSMAGGRRGIAMTAGATYESHGDLRGGSGEQHPSDYEVQAADGKLALEYGDHEVVLSAQYLRQPRTPRYDELVPGFGQTEPSSAVFFFEPNDRMFVHARYRVYDPLQVVEHLEINTAFQEIDDHRRTRDFGSTEEDRERNQSRLTNVTMELRSRWRDWMMFTYGVEASWDEVRSSRHARDIETGDVTSAPSRFADHSEIDTVAAYVQDEIRLGRWTVLGGLRLSYFDVSIPAADRSIGTSNHLTDVTGNLGVAYAVSPSVHLMTNFGRGFRVPNVFDLSTLGARSANRFNVPNADLDPETALGIDAGVRVQRERVRAEFVAFYTSVDDKIAEESTGETTPDGREIVRNANLNRLQLAGIESGAWLRLHPRVAASATVNATWGEESFRGGGSSPADRIPPVQGRIGLSYVPHPRVTIEPYLDLAARQDRLSDRDVTDPRIDPQGTAGWLTMSVRGHWDVTDALRVRVALENLFDETYREHGSGIDAPGFNAVAALEAHF